MRDPIKYIKCQFEKIFKKIKEIEESGGGGSSNLTLEQARQNGNVLEGDVVVLDGGGFLPQDGGFAIGNYYTGTSLKFYDYPSANVVLSDVSGDSPGLVGTAEFNKQGDRLAFAQLGDVYDGQSYSTTETKTGGTWIDGKPIYRIVKLTIDSDPVDIETKFPIIIIDTYSILEYTKTTD